MERMRRSRLKLLVLALHLCVAALCFSHCDARRSKQLLRRPRHAKTISIFFKSTKGLEVTKHFDMSTQLDFAGSAPYVSSPFSMPSYDSLAPIPLPENTPPYCETPPLTTPQPPSSILPLPPPSGGGGGGGGGGYTPPNQPPSSSPILPGLSPPPGPSGTNPSPPEFNPSPFPPEIIPSPTGGTGTAPVPPEFNPSPFPPEIIPSPTGGTGTAPVPPEFNPSPFPPEIIPGPPTFVPSPATPAMSPPYYEPSPPSGTVFPSPPIDVPSPPSIFVPSPLVFLPPVVFPPPAVPPPPRRGPSSALWCVAKPSVPDPIIQEAMNYACGSGGDCDSLQPSGTCFQPDTLFAHASFAFNSYWQRTKAAGGTCDFGGTAMLVTVDPSFDGCHFLYL